jgi:hypothetical protein
MEIRMVPEVQEWLAELRDRDPAAAEGAAGPGAPGPTAGQRRAQRAGCWPGPRCRAWMPRTSSNSTG